MTNMAKHDLALLSQLRDFLNKTQLFLRLFKTYLPMRLFKTQLPKLRFKATSAGGQVAEVEE
jgi:hypothetical protein